MQSSSVPVGTERVVATGVVPAESPVSAISWAAIIAGAFAIAAISLILLALGAGFGFASISPWSNSGASATTFGVAAAVWLIVVQWLSAAFGGYLTGRLRTKWVSVQTDEVYFRDTAHGFLAWAVAAVVTAAVLGSAVSSVIGGASRAIGAVAAPAAAGTASTAATQSETSALNPAGYLVDTLYRGDHPNASASPQAVEAETTRVVARGVAEGSVPDSDRTYLTQLVAARTGLSQPEAAKRVDNVIAQAKAANLKARVAADKARKAASYLSFFTAFSMVIGAFIAAVAATIAGHRRDELLARRRPI
ncbi:MAG: hypothetical protein ACREE9_16995 [Stellaceae bacterium]